MLWGSVLMSRADAAGDRPRNRLRRAVASRHASSPGCATSRRRTVEASSRAWPRAPSVSAGQRTANGRVAREGSDPSKTSPANLSPSMPSVSPGNRPTCLQVRGIEGAYAERTNLTSGSDSSVARFSALPCHPQMRGQNRALLSTTRDVRCCRGRAASVGWNMGPKSPTPVLNT